MSTLAQRHNLQSADVFVAPKSGLNIVKHMIVFLWIDAFGQDHYLENHPQFGVCHLTGTDVESLYNIIAVRKFSGTQQERQLAIQRAVSRKEKNTTFSSSTANTLPTTSKPTPPSASSPRTRLGWQPWGW